MFDLNASGNEFRPRKAHKKSRGGCAGCKQRRIKCTEGKPRCKRCANLGIKCIYPVTGKTSEAASSLTVSPVQAPSPGTLVHSMSICDAQVQMCDLFSRPASWTPPCGYANDLRLLQHFQTITAPTLDAVLVQEVFQNTIARLAWEQPYLMHMILAVSAGHAKRLITPNRCDTMRQALELTAAKHWETGLQLYRSKVYGTSPVDDQFDSIVAGTILITIFSYALNDNVPLDAFLGNAPEALNDALTPLGSTGGFRALHSLFGGLDWCSRWTAVLCSADDECETFSREPVGVEGLPAAFVKLCSLEDSSMLNHKAYLKIVGLLTPLLKLEQKSLNYVKLMAYVGRTWVEYKPLLAARDPRALLLLAYWFTLLRQVDQWWLTTRAKTECMAIVEYLLTIEDPEICALLTYPTSFGEYGLEDIW